jgi:hypothetical protein
LFSSIIICVGDCCLEILITKSFSTFIHIPQHPVSISLLAIRYLHKSLSLPPSSPLLFWRTLRCSRYLGLNVYRVDGTMTGER